MLGKPTPHTSRTLIQQLLQISDNDDTLDQNTTNADLLHERNDQHRYIPRCVSVENLLSCKAWLDQICEHEQAQLHENLEADSKWSTKRQLGGLYGAPKYHNFRHDPAIEHPVIDTAVLERIRDGRGPRDQVIEDLLAPLRESEFNSAETYDEMKEVLQAWNKRVTGDQRIDEDAITTLETAIEKRAELLRNPNDGLDKKVALDESSAELLQALTALRPEVAEFKSQEYFDILVMMWANARVAIPDMDDDLRLLTMKALINEVESKSRTTNARKLSSMARSMSVAQIEFDMAKVERLEAKRKAFEGKMRETLVRKLLDRIKVARGDLMRVELARMQRLTELQATLKWAAHDKLADTASWRDQDTACAEADEKLQRLLLQQGQDLDAHVHVAQSNAQMLSDMSTSLLCRAVEAGFSLKDKSLSNSAELEDSGLKTYLSSSMADVLSAREEAARMLDRMETVEVGLDAMLDVAKQQYREYDGLLRMLNPAGSLSTVGDAETELAGKYGPRRESILLMARNMQRDRNE